MSFSSTRKIAFSVTILINFLLQIQVLSSEGLILGFEIVKVDERGRQKLENFLSDFQLFYEEDSVVHQCFSLRSITLKIKVFIVKREIGIVLI